MSEIAKKAAAEIQAGIKNAVEKAIGQGEQAPCLCFRIVKR